MLKDWFALPPVGTTRRYQRPFVVEGWVETVDLSRMSPDSWTWSAPVYRDGRPLSVARGSAKSLEEAEQQIESFLGDRGCKWRGPDGR